jgi:NAD(P)-dependent dehydrogenase (short-subunit alcohol dehydrogenase family)
MFHVTTPYMDLRDKHVLLTGASSGIGHALALALLREGVHLTSFDKKLISTRNPRWIAKQVDVSRSTQIAKGLRGLVPIDVLINDAGVMRRGKILESSEEDFDALFSINVKGSWLLLKLAQPFLTGRPVIVQMCSRHAERLVTDPGLYSLSKKCVFDLALLVGQTYPRYRVKVLCPGPVDTPLVREGLSREQWKRRRSELHAPEEVAELTVQLLKDNRKRFLTYDEEQHTHHLA